MTRENFVIELGVSYVEMANSQMFPGYVIQFSKNPYPSINDMPLAERQQYLTEMTMIGDALLEATEAIRINYETLGNHHQVVHSHIFPRYAWEEEDLRIGPVYYYNRADWNLPDHAYEPAKHGQLQARIQEALSRRWQEYLVTRD